MAEERHDLFPDTFRFRLLSDNTRASIADSAFQSAHISHDHRNLKVVRYRADSALRSAPVRQNSHIGRREIILHLRVLYIFGIEMNPVFAGNTVNDVLIFLERAVRLPGDYQLITVIEAFKCPQQNIQTLIMPYQTEEQYVFLSVFQAQLVLGIHPLELFSEMGVQRMLAHNVSGIRLQPQQILSHGIAHRDETVTPFQEIFRERSIEETLLVRNHIVQNTDYLAVLSGMSCHEAE